MQTVKKHFVIPTRIYFYSAISLSLFLKNKHHAIHIGVTAGI